MNAALGINLVKRLKKQNRNVITVKIGDEFQQIGESEYTVNPVNHQDYDVLFQELFKKN
jgi:2',3'-cyclic-nucleotide 2'-phosphodiesterase (5'-nucleotidase family)